MVDLKTYTSININEGFWKKIAPIALDLLCVLAIYFSPQIKRKLTIGGIKSVEAISEFLKFKFPKVYAKILGNKKMANFLDNYPDIISSFTELASNELSTKAINIFAKKVINKLTPEQINEIKSLLE